MKKGAKSVVAKATQTEAVETKATIEVVEVKAAPGRPVDPNSARQKRLAEMEARKQNGEIKLGRPADPNSARQKRLAEMEARKVNGEIKLGRPVDPNSKRQLELAAKQALIEAGHTPKRGRPKMVKTEEPTPSAEA